MSPSRRANALKSACAALVVAVLALPLQACGTHDIYVGTQQPKRGVIGRDVHVGFAWGWIGPDIVVDGNAITWVKVDLDPLDLIIRLFTLGIVWPSTVRYRYAQDVRPAETQPGAPEVDESRFYPAQPERSQ